MDFVLLFLKKNNHKTIFFLNFNILITSIWSSIKGFYSNHTNETYGTETRQSIHIHIFHYPWQFKALLRVSSYIDSYINTDIHCLSYIRPGSDFIVLFVETMSLK